jgi:tetratricopeptide (TPR) repeat protein
VIPFLPVLNNGFVNWDDPTAIVGNQRLEAPGIFRWAFTTTLLGHYQPLTWVSWSALKRLVGESPAWFHGVSLLVHAINALLIYVLALRIARVNGFEARKASSISLAAAVIFAVHPLVVEPVAWASAFPYLLSLSFLLLSFLAYLKYCEEQRSGWRACWFAASWGAYAAALMSRESAVAFPLVLLLVDVWVLRRSENIGFRRLVLEKLAFAAITVAGAAIEVQSRDFATLAEVSAIARASMAVTAPFTYLGRVLMPWNLSPLEALPIAPSVDWLRVIAGAAGLAILLCTTWIVRHRWPGVACAVTSYLLLIAPVSGWAPSGVQAVADRYLYIAGIPLAIFAAFTLVRPLSMRPRVTLLGLATVVSTLAVLSWRQTAIWHDSISLWSRASELDSRNDLATYNLAVSLADAGRDDEALARYEQTLVLVPDHAPARRNRDILLANRAERQAAELATLNRLDEAIAKYEEALQIDPTRMRARAKRGIALARRERWAEAVGDLDTAFYQDASDAEVANSLALVLTHLDRYGDAIIVLKAAIARQPEDLTLARTLAGLLATAPTPNLRDARLALRLAQEVCARTNNEDPRALDTLSEAYAANGQLDLARAIALRGRALAHSSRDPEVAALLDARVRSLQLR